MERMRNIDSPYVISIPSGTIKSCVRTTEFLSKSNISIPSGTIKSRFNNTQYKNRANISIPSGTIKSADF